MPKTRQRKVVPLTARQLDAYLARVGFAGEPQADTSTLHAIVGAHVQAIPFENIDVQLGKFMTTCPEAAYAKLVEAGRGGWCYEHNAVPGAALAAIGFDVMRMSAGVMRQTRGLASLGSHLCLRMECEGTWLVDAGFGSWLGAPVPLQQGNWVQPPLPVNLAMTEDQFWRLSVGLGDTAMSYDFREEVADEDQLSSLCHWQCSDPQSVFVQNLSVQRRDGEGYLMLRGKVLSEVTMQGEVRRELTSAAELVDVLRSIFLLDVAQVASLWPAICARHAALFGAQAAATT